MADASQLILITIEDWDGDSHELVVSAEEAVELRDSLDTALHETDE